jgi:hypothetical protein
MTTELNPARCEKLEYPINRMIRGSSEDQLYRGCPTFIRSNVPMWVTKVMGTNAYINGNQTTVNGGTMSGFVNPQSQFRENTSWETAWLETMFQRDHDQIRIPRDTVCFNRSTTDITLSNGQAVSWYDVPAGMRVIPLYITMQYDVASKCLAAGTSVPPIGQWVFNIFGTNTHSRAINATAINSDGIVPTTSPLVTYYNTLFFRGTAVAYLGALVPTLGTNATYAPPVSAINAGDYIMGVRILENTVGIYWVTSNQTIDAPQYFPVAQIDAADITYSMPITRGHQGICTPFYTLRGRDAVLANTGDVDGVQIDGNAINLGRGSISFPDTYSDSYNSTTTIGRDGSVITHAQELS